MMKEPLEVKEFEKIICRDDLCNDCRFLEKKQFDSLVQFIHEFSSDEKHADATEFLKIGYKRGIGDYVSVNNYVGLIQLESGLQIHVLPKIHLANESDDHNEITKRIFIRMLWSLKNIGGKIFNESNLNIGRMNLYEIFINLYLKEVQALIRHGIRSAYIPEEENLRVYKGKILFHEQVKENYAHRERFYVRYDEYQENRPENRLVKSTLLKLMRVSNSASNQKEIRRLLGAFEGIKPSVNFQADFNRVVIDRTMKDYEVLLPWSKVFLFDKSFTTFSGEHHAWALLFPMEKVFESYVAQQLKIALSELKWTISLQDRGRFLFDDPNRFGLCPDIVITRNDNTRIVMDTKWKNLADKPSKDYGISQADMYQMFAYSKKYKTSEVWLLYPINPEMRKYCGKNSIIYRSGLNDDKVKLEVFFVQLDRIKESLDQLKQRLEDDNHGRGQL